MQHSLVASAHEFIAERIGRYFSNRGFRVELVENGMDCASRLQCESPDALILDGSLPVTGASGVCLRNDSSIRLPIVLLTDESTGDSELNDYVTRSVTRPTDIETLCRAVGSVFSRNREIERN
jgi:DNA-binding response OmpR family regulator